MAQGFVVVKVDENNLPTEYWDGTAFQTEVDLSDFVPTKPEARFLQGSLQTQNVDVDVVIKSAQTDITLI